MTDPTRSSDPIVSLLRRWASPRLGRRLSSISTVTWIALALIAIQMMLRMWAASRSWFMWDDYIFLADVARGDTGFTWLFHSHYSLVQPVAFGVVWLIGGVGFNWSVMAASMMLLQLLASLACWWMLRVLFGNRRLIVLPLLFYLFVPMTVPATVWWSVAIYQYPHQIAIFGAIAGHVMYLRSHRLRHLAMAVAFLLLGLGSYIKAPLIVLVLLGISWLWFTAGPIPARVRQLARMWPAWLAYTLATAGYAVLWISRQQGGLQRENCELPGVMQNSIVETIATSITGGPWTWRLWTGGVDPFIAASNCVPQSYRGNPDLVVGGAPQSLAAPALSLIVISWVVLCALALHRWARHRRALLSLWILLPYVAVSAGLVFAGRAATFGSQVSAREIRYFSDVAVIIAFALGTALMPIIGAKVAVRPRVEPFITVAMPRALVRTLVIVFLVGSITSTITYVRPWHSTTTEVEFPERKYISRVEASLRSAPTGPVRIADLPLPVTVANPVIFPYNLPSRKLAPLAPRLQAVQQGTDLQMLDTKGRIRTAMIRDAPRAAPGLVKNCGYLVQGNTTRIPITPVFPGPLWTRVDYLANSDGVVRVRAGSTDRQIGVEQGLHTMFFLTEGDFGAVWFEPDPSLTLCIDNIHVGPVVPKDGGS